MCDLNQATVEALAKLPGVAADDAFELLVWRPYQSWDEVERVPGFDWERVEGLRAAGAVLRTSAGNASPAGAAG